MPGIGLLDWNSPWFAVNPLDWNSPALSAGSSGGADYATYSRGVLGVRRVINLPPRPPRPKRAARGSDTESGVDTQVFIALTEVAQAASFKFVEVTGRPAASVELTLGAETSPAFVRPLEDSLEAAAARTATKTGDAQQRIEEIVAQNVEPDRYMLDVMGMHASEFAATHALLRATILGVNVFCLRMKERFDVRRPSQVVGTGTQQPVLARPPALPLPQHSAFPGGHAMQCAAAADVLGVLLLLKPTAAAPLVALASRIAENREIAGLHYDNDSEVGLAAGRWFAKAMLVLASTDAAPMLTHLLQQALAECVSGRPAPVLSEPGDPASADADKG